MNTIKRDHKGDAVFIDTSTQIINEMRSSRWTHVFHFKHSDGFYYEVDFEKDLALIENPRTDLPKLILAEHKLFEIPLPVTIQSYSSRDRYENYLNKYFLSLFSNYFVEKANPLKIDIFKIVLEKDKLEKIRKFFLENGLKEHEDFILYIIAKIEGIYIQDIEFNEQKDQIKEIRNYPTEVKKLIEVLKLSEHKWSDTQNHNLMPGAELNYITFHYTNRKENSIKLNDPSLISTITKATKEYYNRGRLRNWEKQLQNSTSAISENQLPKEFRSKVIKSLHNFFKGINFYDYGIKKTTDAEMYAIAGILDFAHIKFYDKKGSKYDFELEEDKKNIKQQIRTENKRKELKYTQTHFAAKDLNSDFSNLLKYFDANFINSINPVYSEYELTIAGTITHIFDINHLLPSVVHIFCCLKDWHFKIGHQFEALINNEVNSNKDYHSWKTLMRSFENEESFEEVNLKLSSGDKCSFSENLSLHLLENALKEYYQNHNLEFENDFYESQVVLGRQQGSFRLVTTGKLHQPFNRFLPKFCRECYQFLLCEAPPSDNELQPSEKYYSIIGQLLLEASFFENPYLDEQFIKEQVKYWHQIK